MLVRRVLTQLLLAAVDIKLTEEEIKYLEEAYKPTNVFGHV